ncbi:MAG: hypothetical protein M3R04_00370 [bacterium]|nr:hypothetical protein [bacterium]
MRIAITLIAGLLLAMPAYAAEQVSSTTTIVKQQGKGKHFFNQKHNDAWAWDALKEVSGSPPPEGATTEQMAALVQAQLDKLPTYGEKATALVQPAAPDWLMEGYSRYNGATVQRNHYFKDVADGSIDPHRDIVALYGYWSLYDAEWFSLSRTPGFKAWLSAVALSYSPDWLRLQGEGRAALHSRLVTPIQTKDEPWREIDNWINNFTLPLSSGGLGAFIKPKVRDALVQELLAGAGVEADARMYEQRAYTGAVPERTGLSERQFFLLGALTLEYFQEIYAANPQTKQPLFFRDYFVESFRGTT